MSEDRRIRLAGTFTRYAEEARTRSAAIAELVQGDMASPDAWGVVVLHAHTLAGSGATMGAENISTAGRAIEDIVTELSGAQRAPDAEERAALVALSGQLTVAAAAFDPEASLNIFIAKVYPRG
ncbi:MAG TPA: Hpt domain-containing protein [Patescibacteria group bacterium]|nr:Hpt domain-containing protein [Patescibacteria group bacterium]